MVTDGDIFIVQGTRYRRYYHKFHVLEIKWLNFRPTLVAYGWLVTTTDFLK